MAIQNIFVGSAANDKTGTPARQGGQIINENFAYLNGEIVKINNPDAVLKIGNIEADELNVHVDADAFEWRIDQVDFIDNPEYDVVLDAATDAYYRTDVLLGNNTGGYNIFKGDEDPVSASEPNLFPVGTIKLGLIHVFGDIITGITTDLIGYEKVTNKQNSLAIDGTGKLYPTVDAVNAEVLHKSGDESATGLKEFKTAFLVGLYRLGLFLTTGRHLSQFNAGTDQTPISICGGNSSIEYFKDASTPREAWATGMQNPSDNTDPKTSFKWFWAKPETPAIPYVKVMDLTPQGNLYTKGNLSEEILEFTPTISGQPAIIKHVKSLNIVQPIKLVIYFHGSGTNQLNPFTDTNSKYVIDKLLSEGYIVATSQAHGNAWGNQASQDDYLALYNYINTNYNITDVTYIGHSMGGLASLSMLSKNTISKAKLWYGIMPVTNLANAYSISSFVPDIETAYGFSGGVNYAAATAGYDPQLLVTATYAGKRYVMTASSSDTLVSKANNSDLFNAKMLAGSIVSSVITASGVHGDISHFIPKDVTSFIKNIVEGRGLVSEIPYFAADRVLNGDSAFTWDSVNKKLKIKTGNNGLTAAVAAMLSGSIEFANHNPSNAVPVIVSKSDTSAGLILMAATPDTNASADMILDIRENDNTDYSTLTTSGFGLTRFGTFLIKILRNGRMGIGTQTPSSQLDVMTQNAGVLTDNLTLSSNSLTVNTEVSVFFAPTTAVGNIRGARISAVNDGSNNIALKFYTGSGASITSKLMIHNTGGVSIGNATDPGAGNLSITGKASAAVAASAANDLIRKAEFDAALPISGNYTPTLTAGTNVAGFGTIFPTCFYTRIGNIVTVTAHFVVTITSSTPTFSDFEITIPVTKTVVGIANRPVGFGLGVVSGYPDVQLHVRETATNNKMKVFFLSSPTLSNECSINFSYYVGP